jgi:signal peptidase I
MLPTVRSGQLALIDKLIYRLRPPRRGDIVFVRSGKELWTKRILGLPGEEIEVRHAMLYVNGESLQEPYVAFNDSTDISPGRIGAKCFVVAGDNRRPALVAVVSQDRIVGKLLPLHPLGGPGTRRPKAN